MLYHETVMSRGERLDSDYVNGLRNNKLSVHHVGIRIIRNRQ